MRALLKRLADWINMPEPVASVEAITAVVGAELLGYDPTDDEPGGFVVMKGGVPGVFVVHYPFDADTGLVSAWLSRAERVLCAAGYHVYGDIRGGLPALVVRVGGVGGW